MPKVEADYSNTIIYKLCCNDPTITDFYVGHTTNFVQRKHSHKTNCCNKNARNHNLVVYQCIRANGGWDNWDMIQIEAYNCNNKRHASARERYWIETLKSNLNANNPIATYEEKEQQKKMSYERNKEQILEKAKEHYEENKEHKLEYQKQYAEENKEKITQHQKEYREKNKEKLAEQKKIYREAHKEEASKAQKEWREANKEKNKNKRAQIIDCECGNPYTFGNKTRHLQSKIHITYNDKLCGIIEPIVTEEEQQALKQEKIQKLKEQQKKYREANTEKIKEWKKIHYEETKEKVQEQNKQYYDEYKEHIIEQAKKYAQENKEKIQNYKNDWYQKNKDKILEKQKKTFTCECGAEIRKAGRAEHLKSKKHNDYIISNKTEIEELLY
jgi:hypothetical protein